jgi:hypothetical protein
MNPASTPTVAFSSLSAKATTSGCIVELAAVFKRLCPGEDEGHGVGGGLLASIGHFAQIPRRLGVNLKWLETNDLFWLLKTLAFE